MIYVLIERTNYEGLSDVLLFASHNKDLVSEKKKYYIERQKRYIKYLNKYWKLYYKSTKFSIKETEEYISSNNLDEKLFKYYDQLNIEAGEVYHYDIEEVDSELSIFK